MIIHTIKNSLSIIITASLLVVISFSGCNSNEEFNHKNLKPAEFYHMARNYPDYNNNTTSYLKELRALSLKTASTQKNTNTTNWVTQGPYNHGGRINTIAHNPGNDKIIYIGSSNGGIFKTTDGGKNWQPIFDDQAYLAIGHILVSPHDTNTIYVGTGDPNISGYPWVGNGVYKSSNAGNTWQHIGLDNVGIISKLAIHPNNSDVMYAATMGIPFERNEHRGLYKTTDGGSTWQKVLFLADDAGIIDLLLLPSSPDTIFAAGWNRIRNYNESIAAGSKSRIYRSVDGGNSWDTLSTGLPNGAMSRIGLSLLHKDSVTVAAQFVNASYESEGIFLSSGLGDEWEKAKSKGLSATALGGFGWYFGKIRINPFNAKQLFLLGVGLWESNDLADSFIFNQGNLDNGRVHADKHDMAFIDTNTFLLATDGGLYKTVDGGEHWEDIENVANTQFYRVGIDYHNSGFYAGGAQDNGTIYGNYTDSSKWTGINGGDGFQALFDWANESYLYSESQNGYIYAGTRSSDHISWEVFVDGIDEENRPWDMPLCMSKINSRVLFTGARSIYKNSSAPNGKWEKISHDLTDGTNPFFHFISAIDVSPFNDSIVTAGTSNGKVHIYKEGNWYNINEGLPNRFVSDVFNSFSNEQCLFVSNTGYKINEYIPHIHYSKDLGNTWYDISGNLPQLSVNSIFALPKYNDSVIFAATDGGVYHTLDRGNNWERTGNGMPVIPVYDLAYNDTNHLLVAATYGRSIMAIDLANIAPKRSFEPIVNVNHSKLKPNIYPNPVKDYLHIELTADKKAPIQLYNKSGQLVLQKNLINSRTSINVTQLKPGLYVLQIGNKQYAKKIIVQP